MIAGVPAGLLFLASVALFVQGFPITLLLLPLAAPFLVLTGGQAWAARATWRGVNGAARWWLQGISAVFAAMLSAVLLHATRPVPPEDRAITSDETAQHDAVLAGIAVALVAMNIVAVLLLIEPRRPRWPLASPRAVATLLALVLLCASMAVIFWPSATTTR